VVVPVDEKLIGERRRELRKRQGMSQAELAAELGINQTAVSDYVTGEARIHAAMLATLARVLRT
jgi:transcriptional regulator with XRE-family HTH domain